MKNIRIIAYVLLIACMASCYPDYVKDYDYDATYFANQVDTRSFVVGEGMKIEVGTVLSGVIDNSKNRVVNFKIDDSLVSGNMLALMQGGLGYMQEATDGVTRLLPIPSDYYTISNNSRIVISKGKHTGTVVIRPDSARFLADALTLRANYVLPLYIESADVDTILESKRFTVIGLHYECMLFGNYYHGGVTVKNDASGKELGTVKYATTIPQADALVWALTTVAPFSVETSQISDGTLKGGIRLTLDYETGKVTVGKASGSTINVEADGECYYNKPKLLQDRKIFLAYKYTNADGSISHVRDTLTFRNRIRDGVNEWQDEDPSHY